VHRPAFRGKAAISGAIAIEMALSGSLDPEIPGQSGTRHRFCRVTEMVIRPSEHFQALSWDPIAKKVS
jgi:hypothetical protein